MTDEQLEGVRRLIREAYTQGRYSISWDFDPDKYDQMLRDIFEEPRHESLAHWAWEAWAPSKIAAIKALRYHPEFKGGLKDARDAIYAVCDR